MLFQLLDGAFGWEDQQCDLAALGFGLHVVHYWQGPRSRPDNQTTTSPGDLLFDRNRCVSEFFAEFLRGLLLTLTHVSTVDHHIMLVGHAVDPDRAKRKLLEAHTLTPTYHVPCAEDL